MNRVSQQCIQENEQSEAGKGKGDSLPTMLARKQQWDAANPVTKACHNNLNLWMYLVFTMHFCYHLLWRYFIQIFSKGLQVLPVGFPPKGSCAWLWSHLWTYLLGLWDGKRDGEVTGWRQWWLRTNASANPAVKESNTWKQWGWGILSGGKRGIPTPTAPQAPLSVQWVTWLCWPSCWHSPPPLCHHFFPVLGIVLCIPQQCC